MSIVPFRNLSQQGILIDLAPYSTPLNAWTNGSNVRFDNGKAMRAPVFRAVQSTLIDTPYFVAGFTPSSGYDQVFFVGTEGRIYNYQNAIVSEVSVPSLATSTITITNAGSGYTLAPTVTISAPTLANGVQATATASLTGGVVSSINIVNGGFGYATPPTITLSAPTSGTRATASCTLNFTPYSFVQEQYTSTFLGDVIYFNNPNGVPQYYSNTTAQFENLPYWSSTWTCRSLRTFGDFLVAFNVTKSGVNYANLVKTSDATLYGQPPGSWNQDDQTTLATENPLEQLTSPIVDGCCLGNAMIIYTSDQIWLMQQSGNQLVFQYNQIFSEGGIIAPNCAVEVNGQHYVFGINDLYTHDGSTKQSIASQRVRTFIFQNLNIKESERCFVAHMPLYNEVLFAFPSSDIYAYWQSPLAGCNRGALYNYIQNTWSFIDLPCVMAWSRANVQTEYTFETVPSMDTFANTGGSFYDLIDGYQKFEICVSQPASGSLSASTLLAYDFLDKGQLSFPYMSNVNAPAFIEKVGIDLDQIGGDLTTYKIVKRVYPQVLLFNTASPVYFYVQIGAQDFPSSTVNYDTVTTFNPTTQYKCDMRVGSRYFAIRFTLSADADFEIAGFDLDVISNGKR